MNKKQRNAEYYKKHAERFKANQRVRTAIRSGKIEMPKCVVCGSDEANPWFTDYENPSEFEAYCPKCRAIEEIEIDRVIGEVEARLDDFDYRDFGASKQLWRSKK